MHRGDAQAAQHQGQRLAGAQLVGPARDQIAIAAAVLIRHHRRHDGIDQRRPQQVEADADQRLPQLAGPKRLAEERRHARRQRQGRNRDHRQQDRPRAALAGHQPDHHLHPCLGPGDMPETRLDDGGAGLADQHHPQLAPVFRQEPGQRLGDDLGQAQPLGQLQPFARGTRIQQGGGENRNAHACPP